VSFKEIPLQNSPLKIKVSPQDFDLYCHAKWFLTNNGYASAYICSGYQLIHRLVLGLHNGSKIVCDHINMDKLDNRRENLRACSRGKNNQNVRARANNKLGFKGVRQKGGVFTARISFKNKGIHLGSFKTAVAAAVAYDEAAKKYHGEFANLNFLRIGGTNE
jgi:hypothetical protein